MKLLKFKAWVKEYGVKNLADECGVGPHQVRVWMRGKASPRCIKKIVELSKNELSIEDIILGTTRSKS